MGNNSTRKGLIVLRHHTCRGECRLVDHCWNILSLVIVLALLGVVSGSPLHVVLIRVLLSVVWLLVGEGRPLTPASLTVTLIDDTRTFAIERAPCSIPPPLHPSWDKKTFFYSNKQDENKLI